MNYLLMSLRIIRKRQKKVFLIMRLSFIALSICLVHLSAAVYSQNGVFTIETKNTTMRELFQEIEQQSQFRFFYNDVLTNIDKEVSIDVKNRRINEILDMVLANSGITYRILDNKLIVVSPEALLQQLTVTGVVTDDANDPIPGVNVLIKGTMQGVVTDTNGKYTISVPNKDAVLVFSFVGIVTVEETIGDRTVINVQMVESSRELDEVVVIGYGSVKKKDLTGAVSVIDTKEMAKLGGATIGSSIQGLATGVNVRSSGVAGGESSIEIRGLGNLSNNNPLWVIDGMITSGGRDFNPNDVESIQILKDASAAAIYGSRAANGVIIVTTKKGKKGPMTVDFSLRESFNWSPRYDLMNADEFKKYNDMAYREGIKDGVWNGALQDHWIYDTNWQDETMKTALVQDYNLTLSGGGDFGNFLVSGGYYNDEGMIYGNSSDRYSLRVNTEGKKGIFSFGETLLLTQFSVDPTATSSYIDMVRMLPTIPVYDASHLGGYGYGSEGNARTFGTNPIAREDIENQKTTIYRIRGTVWGEIKIFDFLKYKLNAGIDYIFDDYRYFRREGNWTMNQEYRNPTSSKNRIKETNELVENTLDFNKDFGKHHVDAVAGLTYQHFYWEDLGGQRLKFPYLGGEYFTVLNAGQETQTNWNSIGEYALISYLGRANYNYANKYYLTFTIRRDGISKFSKDNRWDNFPSISGAWRISEESFFNINWINDLKIRGNYGQLGNAAIGVNANQWNYVATIAPSIVTVFGTGQSLVNGATQVKLNNSDLRWEKTKQVNVGFDAAFLKQRLFVTAEYYNSKTTDVLTPMQISMTTGNQGDAPYVNAASLRNTGFEFTANWKDRIGEIRYSVGANVTTVKNEILDLGYNKKEYYTGQTVSRLGYALGEYYLLKTNGLFRTQADIDNYKTSANVPVTIEGKRPQLGDVRYVDTDDNGQITTDDRQIVGNPWPDFNLGLNLGLEWKGLDFSMLWYGQFGNDVLNGGMRQGRYFADNSNYIRFEKGHEPYQENANSDFPRIIYNDVRNTRGDTDMWLEKGSYFRMKNIQLGYTFNPNWISRIGINSLRVYASGSNLITLTKYKGLDPDFINTSIWDRGTDNMAFPNSRSVTLGLQVSF